MQETVWSAGDAGLVPGLGRASGDKKWSSSKVPWLCFYRILWTATWREPQVMEKQGQQGEESFYDNSGVGEMDQGGGRKWSDSQWFLKGELTRSAGGLQLWGGRERELEDDSNIGETGQTELLLPWWGSLWKGQTGRQAYQKVGSRHVETCMGHPIDVKQAVWFIWI